MVHVTHISVKDLSQCDAWHAMKNYYCIALVQQQTTYNKCTTVFVCLLLQFERLQLKRVSSSTSILSLSSVSSSLTCHCLRVHSKASLTLVGGFKMLWHKLFRGVSNYLCNFGLVLHLSPHCCFKPQNQVQRRSD